MVAISWKVRPLAVPDTRMPALCRVFTVTAEPAAFPAAELLLFIPKTDKLFPAVVTGQTVRMPAAAFVPPFGAALGITESLFLRPRPLSERPAAVLTNIALRRFRLIDFYMPAPTE